MDSQSRITAGTSHAARMRLESTNGQVVALCDAAGTGTGNSRLVVTYEIAWTLCGEPGQWERVRLRVGDWQGSRSKVEAVLVDVTRMMVVEEE